MTTLQTLENIPTEELLDAFNLSFSDYIIPFHLTKEQLENKIISESIKLEFSAGAFEDNQLVAFILHGYDIIDNSKILYNAGTGVIPNKRGNKLTVQLYDYILPILHQNSVEKVLLEVITTNEPAIKTYNNIGFKVIRHLDCFKGSIKITSRKSHFEVRALETYDWQKFKSFWDVEPSWQNSITAVEKLKQSNISVGIFENERLLGYIIYNPKIKRIHQFSVDKNYRNKGVGSKLLEYIVSNYGNDLSIINIDEASKETLKFLTTLGMNVIVKQQEMAFNLK